MTNETNTDPAPADPADPAPADPAAADPAAADPAAATNTDPAAELQTVTSDDLAAWLAQRGKADLARLRKALGGRRFAADATPAIRAAALLDEHERDELLAAIGELLAPAEADEEPAGVKHAVDELPAVGAIVGVLLERSTPQPLRGRGRVVERLPEERRGDLDETALLVECGSNRVRLGRTGKAGPAPGWFWLDE